VDLRHVCTTYTHLHLKDSSTYQCEPIISASAWSNPTLICCKRMIEVNLPFLVDLVAYHVFYICSFLLSISSFLLSVAFFLSFFLHILFSLPPIYFLFLYLFLLSFALFLWQDILLRNNHRRVRVQG
jgi:hypothetical protein